MGKHVVMVVICLLAGCSRSASTSIAGQRLAATCASPRSFGAVPDDDLDDRVALQAVLDACVGGAVELELGTYRVVTPTRVAGRPVAMLVVPAGTALGGRGVGSTTIAFSGDNGRSDWRGFQLTSGTALRRMRLTSAFVTGSTVEQTHVARVDGPARGIHLQDLACHHPQNGSKSGDCLQVVGYAPDQLVWDVEVDHVDFEETGRSGVSFHSGLRGSLRPDGHWTTRVHDCRFGDVSDQPIDGEGSGDTDGVEVDHNVFDYPRNIESSAAIQIQASSHVFIHDNRLNGRGIDLYGCDACLLEHNIIEQVAPDFPAVQLRKRGVGVRFVDEVYSRAISAGPGPVVAIAHKLTAPTDVAFDHVRFTQHAAAPVISALGIAGVDVVGSVLIYDGALYQPELRLDALSVSGSGASVSPSCVDDYVSGEAAGIRTTRIRVRDSVVTGPYRATLAVSGSYCGTGSVEVTRVVSSGPQQGLRCEGVLTGAGVRGPVVATDNVMPASACSVPTP